MLGTNDCKRRFNPSAYDISQGVLNLVKAARHSEAGPLDGPPKVLVICPPYISGSVFFGDVFDGSDAISRKLPPFYRQICEESGSVFFDANTLIKPSPADGIHLEAAEHRKLAEAVAEIVRNM
jgi:lysophospholipase L1-like esterase